MTNLLQPVLEVRILRIWVPIVLTFSDVFLTTEKKSSFQTYIPRPLPPDKSVTDIDVYSMLLNFNRDLTNIISFVKLSEFYDHHAVYVCALVTFLILTPRCICVCVHLSLTFLNQFTRVYKTWYKHSVTKRNPEDLPLNFAWSIYWLFFSFLAITSKLLEHFVKVLIINIPRN
jgi:hypothetical protein